MTLAMAAPVVDTLSTVFDAFWDVLTSEKVERHIWLWPTAIVAGDHLLASDDLTDLSERIDDVILEHRSNLLPQGALERNAAGAHPSLAAIAEKLDRV